MEDLLQQRDLNTFQEFQDNNVVFHKEIDIKDNTILEIKNLRIKIEEYCEYKLFDVYFNFFDEQDNGH